MKQIIFIFILTLIFCSSAFPQVENSSCAKIDVTGGGQVILGTDMSFTANVIGITNTPYLEYEWKVSVGTIVSGQGTPSIAVDTNELPNGIEIKAEVKIKGLGENCADTASETGSVTMGGDLFPIDMFGRLPSDEVRARIQNLFLALKDSPNSQGYIISYGTDDEIIAREKQINKAIVFLKLDKNRVNLIRGGKNPRGEKYVWTKIWIVPPGDELPLF